MDIHTKELLYRFNGKKFVVYGAGFYGAIVHENLKKYGFDVSYFIDMHSSKPYYCGLPIIRCEEMSKWHNPQNYVVIITVSDESEHEWISKIVNKYKVSHIIYKHNCLIDSLLEDDNYLYESLTGRERFNFLKQVYGEYENQSLDINLLFKTDRTPLIADRTYLPFFDFFEGRKEMAGEFELQDSRKYRDANTIYRMIHNLWEDGLVEEYYPVVRFDQQSTCIIVENNLEVALFQIAKNYSRIKCRVKGLKIQFPTISQTNALYRLIYDNDITHVYTPIPLDGFYNIPPRREKGGITRVREIASWIARNDISVKGAKVLDAGAYLGFFAQMFYNMGAAKVVSVEMNAVYCKISNMISNITKSGIEVRNTSIEDISTEERFDFTVLLSVLYWYLDTEYGYKIMNIINSVTTKFLFWESGDKIDIEKQFIFDNSDFKSYKMIAYTYGTGKLREFGVFAKDYVFNIK